MQRGMIALSADPITLGHVRLIETARSRCDHLVVLIANNDRKKGGYLFDLKERTEMTQRALVHLDGLSIVNSDGLLVDAYLKHGCNVLFRGVRNDHDHGYEREQMRANTRIYPQLEKQTVFLPATEADEIISSTLVKAYAKHHVDTSRFVPLFVKQMLEERLHKQYKIGVTGVIASGKSRVADRLHALSQYQYRFPATHINVDELIRKLYWEKSEGAHQVRQALAKRFGDTVLDGDAIDVNRTVLASFVFDAPNAEEHRRFVHELTLPHVERLYREALSQVEEGLVIVEWAQMAEMNMAHWTNNNVIVVNPTDHAEFIRQRAIDPKHLEAVLRTQWSTNRKMEAIAAHILTTGHGELIQFDNAPTPATWGMTLDHAEKDISALFKKVCHLFHLAFGRC